MQAQRRPKSGAARAHGVTAPAPWPVGGQGMDASQGGQHPRRGRAGRAAGRRDGDGAATGDGIVKGYVVAAGGGNLFREVYDSRWEV